MLRLSSVLLASTLLATPALAQQAAPAVPQSQPAATDTVGEVVVTAQKREQRLQDVPLSVSVVSGDTLKTQDVTNIQQLQYAVPELDTPDGHFAIRGIGTTTYTRSAESDVSIVVDGVVQGQYNPPQSGLFDLQRVEVLSGPQGMLFGKNASAGVVNIVTTAPALNQFGASGHVDAGSQGYDIFQGVLNVPLGDTAALRASAFHNSYGNYTTNLYNGEKYGAVDDSGGRLRLLWEPTSNLTVNLIGDYEKQSSASTSTSRQLAGLLAPVILACGVKPGPNNLNTCIDAPVVGGYEDYGLSLTIDYRLGDYTITSITADRQHADHGGGDTDGSPLNVLDVNSSKDFDNQFSQELRLTSPTGQRVEYVAGLYFWDFNFKPVTDQAGGIGVLPAPLQADRSSYGYVNQVSYAVFGQATVKLIDGLNLILGGRETRDQLTSSTVNYVNPAVGIYIPGFSVPGTENGGQVYSSGKVDTDNFSYRAGLQYKASRHTMLYLTYSRGYKGPAVNNISPGVIGQTIVKPEIPLDWEAGVKTSLFGNHLTADLSLFDETVKNFQAQVFGVQGGIGQFTFANASHLFARGAELNVAARPIPGLSLAGGVLYNHATYDNFIVQCDAGYTTGCASQNGSLVANAKGLQLAGAPRWKLTASAEYSHSVTRALDVFGETDANYRDDVRSVAAPDPNTVIGGYALVNGRIGVRTHDGRYSLAVFAKNLFDKRAVALIYPDPLLPVAGNYDQSFSPDSFRVIGVSLDAKY